MDAPELGSQGRIIGIKLGIFPRDLDLSVLNLQRSLCLFGVQLGADKTKAAQKLSEIEIAIDATAHTVQGKRQQFT